MIPCPFWVFTIQYYKKDKVTPINRREYCELIQDLDARIARGHEVVTSRPCSGHLMVRVYGERDGEILVLWECSQGHDMTYEGTQRNLEKAGFVLPFNDDTMNKWINSQLGNICTDPECPDCGKN